MLVKDVLEMQIEEALKKGFKATFIYGETQESNSLAEQFAHEAAPGIAKAIDEYIKSADITLQPCPSVTLAGATGPVTGTIQAAPTFFQIN